MRFLLENGALAALLVAAIPQAALAQHGHHAEPAAEAGPSGRVSMKTMGNEAAQAPFLEGLAHLHNFEYALAAPAFRKAQQADPGFVLAYWGEAMTHNHPLWAEQDLDAGRAVLVRLGASAKERRTKVRSPRESMWLDAVEALYGTGSKEERDRAYSERMRLLHEADPADVDARAFYALSILGLAGQGRDPALYMRAAGLLEEVFPDSRDHPGVLHYLIHSYDDPVHAPLGLRAARLYGAIAPQAAHALHMTSHIYLALGHWDDSIRANKAAMRATDAIRAAAGSPPTLCGHYPEWLVYSLLQESRDDEAGAVVEGCRLEAAAELRSGESLPSAGGSRSIFNNWAIMAVRAGIDSGRWSDQGWIPAGENGLIGRFWLAYGDLHRERAAGRPLAEIERRVDRLGKATLAALRQERPLDRQTPRWVERAMVQASILAQAGTARTAGRGTAVARLREAAMHEDGLPVEFGPPALPKPSWELLGDLLLEEGDLAGAADAYRNALKAAPGRKLAVQGLTRASKS